MRRNELIHFVWNWLSSDWKYISIQHTEFEWKEKRYIFNPKGNYIRRIPTTEEMRRILKEQHKINSEKPFVFSYGGSGSPPNPDISIRFRETISRLGLDKEFSRRPCLHDFRHTCASRLVRSGMDLARLMQVMGWKSLGTAQRYIHAFEEITEEDMQKASTTR